jgi:hypothetical protein
MIKISYEKINLNMFKVKIKIILINKNFSPDEETYSFDFSIFAITLLLYSGTIKKSSFIS